MGINNLLTIYCQHFWNGPVHTGPVDTGPVHTGPVYTGSKIYSIVQTISAHNSGQNNVYDPLYDPISWNYRKVKCKKCLITTFMIRLLKPQTFKIDLIDDAINIHEN